MQEQRYINHKLNEINDRLIDVLERLDNMSATIVTRDQFDASLTQAVTTITSALADLQAKIAAGTVVTPEDFSAELAQIQGLASTAATADPGAPATIPATS